MAILIGSARSDERGKLTGGAAGDQKQVSSTNDKVGEVSMQNFYVHSKGWYLLRPKDAAIADKIANNMKAACNNANIGYDQGNRLGIITYGIHTKTKTECDCSSLVRECIKEASGKDPGNFTTANEASVLEASGLFKKRTAYTATTVLYTGDILVTKTKGHTAVVVSGTARNTASEYVESPVSSTYTHKDFVMEVQAAIGAKTDGIPGAETLSKTVTVSKSKNRCHAVVEPIQKYLNSLGYSCGAADCIAGSKFEAAVKAFQKANGCVVDGEITSKAKTWKKLLKLA